MSKEYRISEAFEYKGYFGPPHCGEMTAGILRYTPSEGIKLELIGSIKENIEEVFNKHEIGCIWGELDNGLLVTLFHCYSSFSMNTACSLFWKGTHVIGFLLVLILSPTLFLYTQKYMLNFVYFHFGALHPLLRVQQRFNVIRQL